MAGWMQVVPGERDGPSEQQRRKACRRQRQAKGAELHALRIIHVRCRGGGAATELGRRVTEITRLWSLNIKIGICFRRRRRLTKGAAMCMACRNCIGPRGGDVYGKIYAEDCSVATCYTFGPTDCGDGIEA